MQCKALPVILSSSACEVWLLGTDEGKQQGGRGNREQELRQKFLQKHALVLQVVCLQTPEPPLGLHVQRHSVVCSRNEKENRQPRYVQKRHVIVF